MSKKKISFDILEDRKLLSQIIDSDTPGFAVFGGWYYTRGQGHRDDVSYAPPGGGEFSSFWTFGELTPGDYRVSATWSVNPNRATNAPFSVFDGPTRIATVPINQELSPDDLVDDNVGWEDIGGLHHISGSTLTVQLTNAANEWVIADAVRIERVEKPQTPLPPPTGTGESGIDPNPTPLQTVTVSTREQLVSSLATATPGTHILIQPGNYYGDIQTANVKGTAEHPIVITAADPSNPPVIGWAGEGLKFSDPEYLVIKNIVIFANNYNGINIDDGGTFDTPAHHITISNVKVKLVDSNGIDNGIKLSGVDYFSVLDSVIDDWGNGGSGIDMVGCHYGLVARSRFQDSIWDADDGLQAKGGSSYINIRENLFINAGQRAIQVGGSSSASGFRPTGATEEVRDMLVENNVIIGSEAAIAFTSTASGIVRHNTIYQPTTWAVRILTENQNQPARNGVFEDNIISYAYGAPINLGPGTMPETFIFRHNWWDNPVSFPAPITETEGVYGIDPEFVNPSAGDFHLRPGSPAIGYGAYSG